MIELKHVGKSYRGAGGVRAVDAVDLSLPECGMVAIFGRSGCGKTTLLNCIGGLDAPSEGVVLFGGERVSPDACELRNRDIGYIFQNYNLSKGLTVFENVALALRLCGVRDEQEIERRVMAALESVDMQKYRKRLPDALSGGQQQRVAIARAIVKRPRLILADEPTGNLDEQNTVKVMDILREIAKEQLVLLVTHEADLVDLYCDRVIEMADGRVVSERENAVTGGYVGKRGKEIFLGDLKSEREVLSGMAVEYFGEPEQKPTELRLIALGDTLYIKANTPLHLKLLDSSTEASVHEGKYEERPVSKAHEISPVLREPLKMTGKMGQMYRLKEAIRSGFAANFKRVRRGRRLLIAGLLCFPIVIVLVLGSFGTVFNDLHHIEDQYDANTVFVSSQFAKFRDLEGYLTAGDADLITAEANSYGAYPMAEADMSFCIGNFETFSEEYGSYFYASGFMRPHRIMGERELVCGRATLQSDAEMIITTAYADLLLETTGVNYIKSYKDLLYTMGTYQYWAGGSEGQLIVGIVRGDEPEMFFTEYTYTQYSLKRTFHCEEGYLTDAAHTTLSLEAPARGEIVCSDTALADATKKVGDTLVIGALELRIKQILPLSERVDRERFEAWLLGEYGSYVFNDLSSFSLWWYGVDFTVRSEWEEFYGTDALKRDWETDLEELQEEYDRCYAKELANFERQEGRDVLGAILHPEDLTALAAMLPESGSDTGGLNGFNIFRSNGFYGLHTADPEALIQRMESAFGEGAVITPKEMREFFSTSYRDSFLVAGIAIAVVVLAMSLSLYFIMRSSLMGDIKEIGICRAIGVSRHNLLFRYLVETLVLFSLTVFVGYLLSSVALFAIGSLHAVMAEVLYYPLWMAALALLGLLSVSILCGLAPIWSLLRRTPAEILAKYDI